MHVDRPEPDDAGDGLPHHSRQGRLQIQFTRLVTTTQNGHVLL